MKKNSKKSLREWIKKIRYSEYKLKELKDDLEYLLVRSIGVSSPNLDIECNSPTNPYSSKLPMWLDRISDCERKIKEIEAILGQYKAFRTVLTVNEVFVLDNYFWGFTGASVLARKMNVSRNRLYEIISLLERKYSKI